MFIKILTNFVSLILFIELVFHQVSQPCFALRPARVSETKCHEYQNYVYENSFNISETTGQAEETKLDTCGVKSRHRRIVGGTDAEPLEFPHMALIGFKSLDKSTNKFTWMCGGSLISDRFILTVSACTKKPGMGEAKIVRLGELNIASDSENASPEDFEIENKYIHPDDSRLSHTHNIALLELSRRVILNKYKRPACLASSFDWPEPYAWVTGWGFKDADDRKMADHLQKVKLEKFTEKSCQLAFENLTNISYAEQVCMGSETEVKDTCGGDLGGPLQILHSKEYCMWEIVGITTFGKACASVGVPSVYVRIYIYIDWIEQIVWK